MPDNYCAEPLTAVAARIDAHAAAARAQVPRLAAAFAAVRWTGPAAQRYHGAAHGVLHTLYGAAARLDIAADTLRAHAEHVRGGTR